MLRSTDFYTIKPGRRQELINLVVETAPHVLRHDATAYRLMSAFLPVPGSFYTMAEYESMAALASSQEAIANDSEAQELRQRWTGKDAPITGVTRLLLQEVQRSGAPPSDFGAVIVRGGNVRAGRLDDFLILLEQVGAMLAAYGAGIVVSTPVLGHTEAGPDLYYGSRFPDMATLARWLDDAPGNEMLQRIDSEMTGQDAPVIPVANGISTRIPLQEP